MTVCYDLEAIPIFPAQDEFIPPLCQIDADTDEELFKQIKNLFKQKIDPATGQVIGLEYKMFNGEIQTLNLPDVRSRYNTYKRRPIKTKTGKTKRPVYVGRMMWEYALSLFENPEQYHEGNRLKPIRSEPATV